MKKLLLIGLLFPILVNAQMHKLFYYESANKIPALIDSIRTVAGYDYIENYNNHHKNITVTNYKTYDLAKSDSDFITINFYAKKINDDTLFDEVEISATNFIIIQKIWSKYFFNKKNTDKYNYYNFGDGSKLRNVKKYLLTKKEKNIANNFYMNNGYINFLLIEDYHGGGTIKGRIN